jgi:hypothetical protein
LSYGDPLLGTQLWCKDKLRTSAHKGLLIVVSANYSLVKADRCVLFFSIYGIFPCTWEHHNRSRKLASEWEEWPAAVNVNSLWTGFSFNPSVRFCSEQRVGNTVHAVNRLECLTSHITTITLEVITAMKITVSWDVTSCSRQFRRNTLLRSSGYKRSSLNIYQTGG